MSGKNVTHIRALYDLTDRPLLAPIYEAKSLIGNVNRRAKSPNQRRRGRINQGVETPKSLALSDAKYEKFLEIFQRGRLANAQIFPRLAARLLRHFFVLWGDRFYSLNALALRSQRTSANSVGSPKFNEIEPQRTIKIVTLRYGADVNGIRNVYFDESDQIL
jgi:hypothetical protein